jgi:TatD DNase family protein
MYIDIHTHHPPTKASMGIQNIDLAEAASFFSSITKGYYSIGIHPWNADHKTALDYQQLEVWAMDKRVVAIGECGLDKKSRVPLEVQLTVFEKQIELSEKLQKPMIIHCVACFNELLEIKRRRMPTQLWIIHGFRGKPELAGQILKSNCALSFGAYFNLESVKITPIEKLYIESDDGKVNISELYDQIARLKGCSLEELSAGIHFFENYQLK